MTYDLGRGGQKGLITSSCCSHRRLQIRIEKTRGGPPLVVPGRNALRRERQQTRGQAAKHDNIGQ